MRFKEAPPLLPCPRCGAAPAVTMGTHPLDGIAFPVIIGCPNEECAWGLGAYAVNVEVAAHLWDAAVLRERPMLLN